MRRLTGPLHWTVTLYAAGVGLMHLYLGGFGFPAPLEMRALHIGLLAPLPFLLWPARPGRSPAHRPSVPDWVLAALSVLPSAYMLLNAEVVYDRMEFVDPLTPLQFGLGVLALALMFEAIRRAVEAALAWMVAICLAYMWFGHLLPGVFNARPFSIPEIIETAYIVPIVGGIYGPLTGIVATTIALFILFGAFVQGSGTGRLFNNFGAAAAGRFSGGPAKVAVITSGLFGTMSGSSVSNVITTGAITIPLMIRLGYRRSVAGGIESAAAVGGALMPPVMGAAAFVMAEITNIPYGEIIVAAAIGAVLYYFAIFAAVHFEAKRIGIAPMARDEIPTWMEVARDAHLLIPIGVLVYLLQARWSGNFAAFCCCIAMVAVAMLRRHTRMSPHLIIETLAAATTTMAILAVSIAGAGVLTSALTVTGLVVAFGGIIKAWAGGSLALLLILLMLLVLILGTGIPTTPSYIIAAAVGAPLLLEHGVPLIAAHLFLFYFAVLADATPPVAVAAFAAAAIAKSNPTITGLHATRFAVAGFTVGFALIYDPAIMLRGPLLDTVLATTIQVVALTAVAVAYGGFCRAPLAVWARVLAGMAGALGAFGHFLPDAARLLLPLLALLPLWLAPGPFMPGTSRA